MEKKQLLALLCSTVAYLVFLLFAVLYVARSLDCFALKGLFPLDFGDIVNKHHTYYQCSYTPTGFSFLVMLLLCQLGLTMHLIYTWVTKKPQVFFDLKGCAIAYPLSLVLGALWLIAWGRDRTVIALFIAIAHVALVAFMSWVMKKLPHNGGLHLVCVKAPFSLLLAWHAVTLLVNASYVLDPLFAKFIPRFLASLAVVLLITVPAALMLFLGRDPVVPAVATWALLGILISNFQRTPAAFRGEHLDTAVFCALAMLALLVCGVVWIVRRVRLNDWHRVGVISPAMGARSPAGSPQRIEAELL